MIHVRIDRLNPSSVDIYVDVSERSSSLSASCDDHSTPLTINDEHIYDRLFDQKSHTSTRSNYRQSTIVKNRSYSSSSSTKKHYTLQQILDNVDTIQEQYEQVVKRRKTSTTLTCLSSFKQLSRLVKNLRTIKSSSQDESNTESYIQDKSPFMFGGETFQWIAFPQDEQQHIYENDLIS
jgi:hypothetical protein